MGFQQTDEQQVTCTCGRFYHVGEYCSWCQKTVEPPAEHPAMAEGEEAPSPEPAPPPEEGQPDEPPDEEEEPAAAETPPVEPPIATPPTEGRRSRRER